MRGRKTLVVLARVIIADLSGLRQLTAADDDHSQAVAPVLHLERNAGSFSHFAYAGRLPPRLRRAPRDQRQPRCGAWRR
jgi:hypothetical protein